MYIFLFKLSYTYSSIQSIIYNLPVYKSTLYNFFLIFLVLYLFLLEIGSSNILWTYSNQNSSDLLPFWMEVLLFTSSHLVSHLINIAIRLIRTLVQQNE